MTNRRPADHVRIGSIDAAIWQNDGPKGRPIYNVTLQRSYRDPETGEWGNTTSFGRDDLLVVAKVVDAAHTRICELQTLDRLAREKREREDPGAMGDDGAEPSEAPDADNAHAVTAQKVKARAKTAGASR